MVPSHVPANLCVLSDAELLGPPTMLLLLTNPPSLSYVPACLCVLSDAELLEAAIVPFLLTNPPSHGTLSCASLFVCAV